MFFLESIESCNENFERLYPGLDQNRTVMRPSIFRSGYKAPTDEKAAGYSKSAEKLTHIFKGEEAERKVHDALAGSGQPMFVIGNLKFSPSLPSILESVKEECEIDFVIIHRNIGVVLVEVKGTDSKPNYKNAIKELKKGERIIKNIIELISKEMKDKIPVYKSYAAPNNELTNTNSTYVGLDNAGVNNIRNWFLNFPTSTFNTNQKEVLDSLCSVLVTQKTEPKNAGCSDQVLAHEINNQIFREICHQSFLRQSYEERANVVSTRDRGHPHLATLQETWHYINEQQRVVWEGPLHQIIDGTPGSGKTILLVHKALDCAKKGEKCRVYAPPMLVHLLKKIIKENGIDEHTVTVESFSDAYWDIHDFCSITHNCHIFIDEFQLSLNLDSGINLDFFVKNLSKNPQRYFWIACNQTQPCRRVIKSQIQMMLTWFSKLEQLGFERSKLTTCVRSTKEIQIFDRWYREQQGVNLPYQSVYPGHNIAGDKVNVYYVEDKDGNVRGNNHPPCVALSGTISWDSGPMICKGIAKIIKKEIEERKCSLPRKCAVFFSEFRNGTEMLEAMIDQGIPVSLDPLSNSDAVYFGQGSDLHSYEWDTVIVISEPFGSDSFPDNHVMFTRAICKLVVIFYTEPTPIMNYVSHTHSMIFMTQNLITATAM